MVQYYNTGERRRSNLSAYADEVFRFATVYSDKMFGRQEYGKGNVLRVVEAMTLFLIECNPGITVSELAQKQKRTKGTVSLNVGVLEKGGYIRREKRPGNAKVVHLYTTPKGEQVSTLFNARQTLEITREEEALLESCTSEEINTFCRVLHQYLKIIAEES